MKVRCMWSVDICLLVFFFKQKTAYEMRISDWSSDVCSSDLCLSACTTTAPLATQAPAASLASPTVLVPERYVSADNPGDEVDSLATWPTEDGHTWLVATAKSSHSLVVFDAD